ncbi:hypothetical protein GCM10027200_22180 [Lentzea nigeriaca]
MINVIRLNGRRYSGGHYATIVGYRAGGNEFAVADPAYAGGRGLRSSGRSTSAPSATSAHSTWRTVLALR